VTRRRAKASKWDNKDREPRPLRGPGFRTPDAGESIEADAVELGLAMMRWKSRTGRWWDCADVLRVAKSLGWSKQGMTSEEKLASVALRKARVTLEYMEVLLQEEERLASSRSSDGDRVRERKYYRDLAALDVEEKEIQLEANRRVPGVGR
jgi:hypothetical protein